MAFTLSDVNGWTPKRRAIAEEIINLEQKCFHNGRTIDGKGWNEGNDAIREAYKIDSDEWRLVRDLMRRTS